MGTDIGGIFEQEIQKVFKSLKESHAIGWHRFPDTSAAGGNIIQEQPSDYLVGFPRGTEVECRLSFVEAKASRKHRNLTKSFIRPGQRGAIHFYVGILDLTYILLFWDTQGSRIEVWDGWVALTEGSIRKQSPIGVIENAGSHLSLNVENVANGLVELFKIPPKAVTLETYRKRIE